MELASMETDIRMSAGAGMIRVSSADVRATKQEEEIGTVEILKLAPLVFNFVQMLDPIMYLINKGNSLITWKYPYKTIAMGIFLTLVISSSPPIFRRKSFNIAI